MYSKHLQSLNSNQGKALSEEKKWDIIAVMQRCKLENEISPIVSTKSPKKRTAKYLNISAKVVSQVYSYYLEHGTIPDSCQGNHTNHPTLVNTDIELSIRRFMRERHLETRYTTANDVIKFVEENFLVKVNIRTMQRTLTRLGMAWRKSKKKGKIYRESPEVIQKRRTYLHAVFEYRNLPPSKQYLEVWTDESYIHHHHAFNGSKHGVEDFVGRLYDGRRLVILAAGSKLGFIPNSLKVYGVQKSSGDYLIITDLGGNQNGCFHNESPHVRIQL